ncbi:MAG: hypothetical protein PVG91_07785 [Gammaproteobacteria bacterium]|jgi:hypothetical protein
MTEFEGVLGYQVRTMLDGIAKDVASRRQTTLDAANQRARTLLAGARHKARQRVRQAVAEERQLIAHTLDKTRAALASRQRRRQQAVDVERLERGRALLGEALRIRWENPETRAEWVQAVMQDARSILQEGNWHIQYPEGIDEDWITGLIGNPPGNNTIRAVPDIKGGLRIQRGAACLEMTIAGLMARADDLSSELLAEIYGEETDPVRERSHG